MIMSTTEAWLDIWFKPYLYMHRSWMCNIDQRLLTDTNSSLAWQGSYQYLCRALELRCDYRELHSDFIRALANDFFNGEYQALDMASFMVTGTFKLDDVELEQKRFLVQRSRALSLKKRIYEPIGFLSEIDAGLLLVRLLCQAIDLDAWQRIRLFFDKSRVNFIEASANAIELTDITRRSIIRACSEIYQLKYQQSAVASDIAEESHQNNPETASDVQQANDITLQTA